MELEQHLNVLQCKNPTKVDDILVYTIALAQLSLHCQRQLSDPPAASPCVPSIPHPTRPPCHQQLMPDHLTSIGHK